MSEIDPALQKFIRDDLERLRNQEGFGCWSVFLGLGTVVSFGLGAYLVHGALRYNHVDEALQFGALLGGATVLMGLGSLLLRVRSARVRSPLHAAVVERRTEVVWVYPRHERVNVVDSLTRAHKRNDLYLHVTIAFADGTATQVGVTSTAEQSEMTAVLARWLPHAQHGYSKELEQAFVASPSSLRKR